MTVGVGEDVAYAATPEQPRAETGWHARFTVAFGGAVVAVSLMLLGSLWNDGLRASTFDRLSADISDGAVQEWYVADSIDGGILDRLEARPSSFHDEVVTDGGVTTSTSTSTRPPGDPTGGILVWRSWGHSGWEVAAPGGEMSLYDGLNAQADDQSKMAVKQLRDAGVSMRPFDFGDSSSLESAAAFGAFLVFAGLVMGSAPRVGTRWFWFWLLLNGPLALGFMAYAVMELIGFRRRPDPPLAKRLSGLVGFVGALLLSFAISAGADFLRQRGVPLPL